MRSLQLVVPILVVLLAASAVGAQDLTSAPPPTWEFIIDQPSLETPPGGTTQWTWTINNFTASPTLNVDAGDATWLPSFILNSPHMAGHGKDFVVPGPIAPGGSATGNFYHIDWKPTAPLGTHVSGFALVDILNGDAIPPKGIQNPIEATVTPELPPGVLGLLSFLPYGMWRLRMRKKQ